jgi:hypothetical protein
MEMVCNIILGEWAMVFFADTILKGDNKLRWGICLL